MGSGSCWWIASVGRRRRRSGQRAVPWAAPIVDGGDAPTVPEVSALCAEAIIEIKSCRRSPVIGFGQAKAIIGGRFRDGRGGMSAKCAPA